MDDRLEALGPTPQDEQFPSVAERAQSTKSRPSPLEFQNSLSLPTSLSLPAATSPTPSTQTFAARDLLTPALECTAPPGPTGAISLVPQ